MSRHHLHDILRERLLKAKGLWEYPAPRYSYNSLAESEWSPLFEQLMRNRLIMGALRYGLINAPNKPTYDRVASIKKRADLYKQTGNDEFLVDIANLCLLEFIEGIHPQKHFSAVDDTKEHVTIVKKA